MHKTSRAGRTSQSVDREQLNKAIHLRGDTHSPVTTANTVRALMAYGLSNALLQRAFKMAEPSIRNLATGSVQRPHPGTLQVIDDLRSVVSILDHTGMDPVDGVNWLQRRHLENMFFRPIDDIRPHPSEVLGILPAQFGTNFESSRFPGEMVHIGALLLSESRAYVIENGEMCRIS